ncbi:phage tail protein [Acidovorax lacteus]|uniref:Tail fiber protein n=1 Tax=Acidovorax lacteus TaxID=1924988 RepID=A0ABP8LAZ3_9BURK
MEAYLGEIRVFPFQRIPQGWAPCDGRLLPIAQHTALFQLLGTRYGGDGVQRFAIPDLRGRVPVGFGQVMGGMSLKIGTAAGAEAVALTEAQVPSHSHALLGAGVAAATHVPAGAAMAQPATPVYGTPQGALMSAGSVEVLGASQPHSNMQPSLVLSWCMALQGLQAPA